jgi:hypothetical protein
MSGINTFTYNNTYTRTITRIWACMTIYNYIHVYYVTNNLLHIFYLYVFYNIIFEIIEYIFVFRLILHKIISMKLYNISYRN